MTNDKAALITQATLYSHIIGAQRMLSTLRKSYNIKKDEQSEEARDMALADIIDLEQNLKCLLRVLKIVTAQAIPLSDINEATLSQLKATIRNYNNTSSLSG